MVPCLCFGGALFGAVVEYQSQREPQVVLPLVQPLG
jgi:hypothetical protein